MRYTNNIINNNKTLVAIPVYNEAVYIEAIISEVLKYNDNILIINDGSIDETSVLLKHHKQVQVITHKINQGYGQSLIDAFEYAKNNGYDWVITMDCDHQHQPLCIPQFLDRIIKSKFDIVSGSRYLLHTNIENVPPDRLRINRQITALLNSILKINITDAFCGFKA
jgi:dolichol-phosphate mannosyltransferase